MAPYMSLLTRETQASYKNGRSAVDILTLVQNKVQNEEEKQLTPIDLSKAFDSIERNILWIILYEKGLHCGLITEIRTGHRNYLYPKYNGVSGQKLYNKGVSQGSPIGAILYHLLGSTDRNLRN